MKRIILIAGALTFGCVGAKTCTYTFTSLNDLNWSDTSKWDDQVLPAAGDDVVLKGIDIKESTGGILTINEPVPAIHSLAFDSATAFGMRLSGSGSVTFEQNAFIDLTCGTRLVIDTKVFAADESDTLTLSVKGGYFQPEKEQTTRLRLRLTETTLNYIRDAALGPVPATYDPEALVLNRVAIGQFNADYGAVVIPATRGITLVEGTGNTFSPATQNVIVHAPICGDGDVLIGRGEFAVTLMAANTYTGATTLNGSVGKGTRSHLILGCAAALPSSTVLSASQNDSNLTLAEGVTTVAGVTGERIITFDGAGTLRVNTGTHDFDAKAVKLEDGVAFQYAGLGAINPRFASKGVTYTQSSGTLAITADTGASRPVITLTADTSATVSEGALFAGALLSADAANPVTVTLSNPLVFGREGDLASTLDVILSPAANVTLAGVVNTTLPTSGYVKRPGYLELPASLSFEPGDQVLADGEARYITSSAQTGTGTESLSLTGASTVYLVAEDANDALAVAYDVTLGETDSTLSLSGAGTIEFAGTLAGSGRVILNAATVRAFGDWSSVTVTSVGGVLEVPAGETLTLGAVTGPLVKTGAGELVLTGASHTPPALQVRAGTVRLASPAAGDGAFCVANEIVVAEGATLALGADRQLSDETAILLQGTFDLNGHTVQINTIKNGLDTSIAQENTSLAAQVINTATAEAVLEVMVPTYYGAMRESPGKIRFVPGYQGGLFAPAGQAAVSTIDLTNLTGTFVPYSMNSGFKFMFDGPADPTRKLIVPEVVFLWKGKPVPVQPSAFRCSSALDSYGPEKIYDAQVGTSWRSGEPGAGWVEILFEAPVQVDAYRISYYDAESAPTGWTFQVYRHEWTGYLPVDEQHNLRASDIAVFDQMFTRTFPVDSSRVLGSSLGANTSIVLPDSPNHVRLRVSSNEPLVVGTLTGAAGTTLEYGADLAPGDLTGYSGTIDAEKKYSYLSHAAVLLDGTRGPTAQPVTAHPANTVRIANAGTEPVAVLMDDTRPANGVQYGQLDGTVGLLKRGTGTTVLSTEDAQNTGVTKIESGTLRVQSVRQHTAVHSVTARYLRIRPLCVNGGRQFADGNKFNWAMNDFQLTDAAGNRVSWPSGTVASAPDGLNAASHLIDGNLNTRCLVYNPEKSGTTSALSPVTIDAKTPVTFAGIQWYTPHGNEVDIKRTPVELALDVSDDGVQWRQVLCAKMPFEADPCTTFSTSTPGHLKGPYALTGASTLLENETGLTTLPEEHLVAGTVRETRAPALKAQYFKFRPWRTRNPNAGSNTSYGWMLSEISLWRNGQRLEWPSARTITCTGAQVIDTNQSRLTSLVNNITTGGTTNQDLERCFVGRYPCVVTINAHELVEFDAWSFTSSAGGGWTERLPVDFDLQISNDGQTWQLVDVHANEKMPETIYTDAGPWPLGGKFPLLTAGVPNRIGDASPVDVAAGATLQLATDYEKFGTLTGAGTVELDCGATAEINTDAAAAGAFSGVVTGAGTLVLGGAGVQTFDGADLSGVKTLEFNGGAMRGTLTSAGALRVTGAFRVALPDPVTGAYKATLITAGSLDADTRAVLEAAQVHNPDVIPGNYALTMKVTDTSATLHLAPKSLVIVIR